MVFSCVVIGCTNRKEAGHHDNQRSFHRFPHDPVQAKKWLKRLSLEKVGQPWIPNLKRYRICSDHFLPEDYKTGSYRLRILKKTSVPSVFPKDYQELYDKRPMVKSDGDEDDSHGDVNNRQHQPKQSNPISESQVVVPHIVLDTPNPSDSFVNKDVFDNVLRIQKPFLDCEVMMLLEEYLQLCEMFQNLKKLARINVDLLYLGIDVNKAPGIKVEVDKVQDLIQTLMNGRKVCGIEIFCVENIVRAGDIEILDRQQNASVKGDVDAIKGCDVEHSISDDDDDYHEDNETSLPFDGRNNVNVDEKLHVETSEKEGNESQQPTKISNVPQHHSCHLCDRTFASRSQFSVHLKTDHKDEVHKCKICSLEFERYRDFSRHHQRLHDDDLGATLCSICGQTCKNRQKLMLHLKLHEEHENGPYKCTLCCKELKSKPGLKNHMKTHMESEKVMCDLCGGVYDSVLKLRSHRRLVHIQEPKVCPICGKKIKGVNMRRHIRGHSGSKPYKCSICQKTFTQNVSLQVHLRTHTRKYPHQCSYCNKGFNCPSLLRVHEYRHLRKQTYRCEKCDKVFESEALANAHKAQNDSCNQTSFSVVRDKPYKCTVCPRQFASSISFALHMLSHSDCKELDHCLLCNDGKSFTSFSEFESHLKTVHLSEKPFKCSVCGESFFTYGSLHNHRAMHTGALTCKECGKSFKSYVGLHYHLKLKHNPEPLEFTCDICGMRLCSAPNLNRHRRIHTGFKPCKCSICGYSLTSKSALKLHLRTHTNEKKFQCEKCEKGFNDKRNYVSHLKKWHPESCALSC